MKLKNQGVLITGASKGLGRALSRELASRGAHVAMVARHQGPLNEAVREIRAEGGAAHALAFDVSDKDSIYRIAGAAAELVGDIEVLVHNASTLGAVPLRPLIETDCEDLEQVWLTNVLGPFRLTKAILGGMLLRGRGAVIALSSDAAVAAYPTWGAYSASKAASDHLTRVLAAESWQVRFLSIDPGEMDTDMHAAAMPEADRSSLARPADVASKIANILASIDRVPNGARLVASSWSVA